MNCERLTFLYSKGVAFTFSSNLRDCLTEIRVSTLFCQHFVVGFEMTVRCAILTKTLIRFEWGFVLFMAPRIFGA